MGCISYKSPDKIKNTEVLPAGVTSRRDVSRAQRGDYKLPNHWELRVNNESCCRPMDFRAVTGSAELRSAGIPQMCSLAQLNWQRESKFLNFVEKVPKVRNECRWKRTPPQALKPILACTATTGRNKAETHGRSWSRLLGWSPGSETEDFSSGHWEGQKG